MSATNPTSASTGMQNWHELYKTALFEGNRQESSRITPCGCPPRASWNPKHLASGLRLVCG